MIKKIVPFFSMFIFLVILDGAVKILINKKLAFGQTIHLFLNVSLMKLYNVGIAFSLLSGRTILVIGVTVVAIYVLAKLLIEFFRENDKLSMFSITLILAGAFGNLLDRSIYRYVIDYIRIDLGRYTFPIFNLADIYIFCGVLILIIRMTYNKEWKNGKNNNNGEQ